jgi:TolA-binding protein
MRCGGVIVVLACMLCLPVPGRAQGAAADAGLTAARAALEDGLFPLAQKQVESHLAAHPEALSDPGVFALLLEALHGQRKHKQIVARVELAMGKGAKGGAYDFWRALARYELDQPAEALRELQGFNQRYPKSEYDGRKDRLSAWCCLALGNTNGALQAFERFDRSHAGSPDASQNLLEWSQVLIRAGRFASAGDLLVRVTGMKGNTAHRQEAAYRLGEVLSKQGNWAGAVEILTGLSRNEAADPDLRARAFLSLAQAREAQTNHEEAVTALAEVEKLARRDDLKRDARANTGRLLLSQRRMDDGIPIVRQFVREHPDDERAGGLQLQLAEALLESGKYEQSAEAYLHHLETFTNSTEQAEAHRGRGWALFSLERYSEAVAAFEKAHKLFKNPVSKQRCLFKMGDAYLANKQNQKAAETYRRFLSEHPRSDQTPRVHLLLAEALRRSGALQEAKKVLVQVSEQYVDTRQAEESLLRLGDMLRAEGRWGDALERYGLLVDTYTNSSFMAEGLAGRGLVHYRLFAFDKAEHDYARLVKEFPESLASERGQYMLGLSYYCLRRDSDALATLTKLAEQRPNSSWAAESLFWIGKYDYNRGAYDGATNAFLSVADKYPGHTLADKSLLFAGWACLKRKEYVQAIEILGKLAKAHPESPKLVEARFAQGDAMRELAQFSGAILVFDEIIHKHAASPLVARAWLRRGDCQFMLGTDDEKRYEEAIHSYRVVAGDQRAAFELALEAEYKVGRGLEKLGRGQDALDQYHAKVMVSFLEAKDEGEWLGPEAEMWFTRASFNAAEILEARGDWSGVVRILERVVLARVPAADETRARIQRIRSEHFWLFY